MSMDNFLSPGAWVRHPGEPDWGYGQVQSSIGGTVTVNFENAGKRVINAEVILLEEIGAEENPPPKNF